MFKLYEGLLLISALCLSVLTRQVGQNSFRTAKSNAIFLYFLTGISAVGFPLYFIALEQSWDIHVSYVLFCAILNGLLFICVICLFVPPVVPLARDRWNAIKL